MEPFNLNEQQRLYLQSIFDYFHVEGKWPTDKYLEQNLFQTRPDLDTEQVLGSLLPIRELINVSSYADGHVEISLTILAIYLCSGSEDDLMDFVHLVHFCVYKHFTSEEDAPQITSGEILHQLSMSELSVRKVGQLLKSEHHIHKNFRFNLNWTSWSCKITKNVRCFRGIETIEQYLAGKDTSGNTTKLVKNQITTETPKVSPIELMGEQQIHPDVRSKCWGLYINGKYDEAILNATKALEVAVRTKASLPQSCVGIDTINAAFSLKKPLPRYSKVEAEQEGMMSLLRGMIQVFKNPQSHRFVGVRNKSECLGVLLMCSNLLYVIDNAEYVG